MKKFLLILIFYFGNLAAQVDVYYIYVDDMTTDMVGNRLAYKIKEELKRSSFFYLMNNIPNDNSTFICLIVNSMDRFKGQSNMENISTMYSYVVLMSVVVNNTRVSIYLYSSMGYSGSNRLQESAESIVSEVKKYLDNFLKPKN